MAPKVIKTLKASLTWPRGETMRMYAKPMPRGRRTAFLVKPSDTISDFKEMIITAHPRTTIDPQTPLYHGQRQFPGMQLEGNRTIASYNIEHGDILYYQAT